MKKRIDLCAEFFDLRLLALHDTQQEYPNAVVLNAIRFTFSVVIDHAGL